MVTVLRRVYALRRGMALVSPWHFVSSSAGNKAVSTAYRRPSHLLLLLLAQENVTQEKGVPDGVPSGHPALRVRGWVPGVRRQDSCPDVELARIPACQPAGLSSTHPPRHRGPEEQRAPARRSQTKPRARHWIPASAGMTSRQIEILSHRPRRGVAVGVKGGATPVPNPSGDRACRLGGFHQAISLGYFSLLRASCPPPFGPAALFATAPGGGVGPQREVTRAAAAARDRSVPGNKASSSKIQTNGNTTTSPNSTKLIPATRMPQP